MARKAPYVIHGIKENFTNTMQQCDMKHFGKADPAPVQAAEANKIKPDCTYAGPAYRTRPKE